MMTYRLCIPLLRYLQSIGRNFSREYSVILRKLLRVVETLPLSADDVYGVRSVHGTFADVLQVGGLESLLDRWRS